MVPHPLRLAFFANGEVAAQRTKIGLPEEEIEWAHDMISEGLRVWEYQAKSSTR